MLIPVVMKREGVSLPHSDADARYVVADNAVFLERSTEMFESSIRIPRSKLGLDVHDQYCRLKCAKIPRVMVRAMLGFFKYAHEVHGGEVALILLYHPQRRVYRWHCPVQTVEVRQTSVGLYTCDYIEFDHPFDLPDGFLHFGDAHLHPGSPQPSAVDIHDDQDGLHIIVGDILKKPRYHIDFVVDQTRFGVSPKLILEDPWCEPIARPPKRWLRQIRIKKTYVSS